MPRKLWLLVLALCWSSSAFAQQTARPSQTDFTGSWCASDGMRVNIKGNIISFPGEKPVLGKIDGTSLFVLGQDGVFFQKVDNNTLQQMLDDVEGYRWTRCNPDNQENSSQIQNAQAIDNIMNSATAFYYGNGVQQNYIEALKLFRKAADLGSAEAFNFIGIMYQGGQGVAQNFVEAAKWYKIAADKNLPAAQSNLGYLYNVGQGVPQNFDEAVNLYRKAAEAEYPLGQDNLGIMYQNGQGVQQSNAEAIKWYTKAANRGSESAKQHLAALKSQMAAQVQPPSSPQGNSTLNLECTGIYGVVMLSVDFNSRTATTVENGYTSNESISVDNNIVTLTINGFGVGRVDRSSGILYLGNLTTKIKQYRCEPYAGRKF